MPYRPAPRRRPPRAWSPSGIRAFSRNRADAGAVVAMTVAAAVAAVVIGIVGMHALAAAGHGSGPHQHPAGQEHHHGHHAGTSGGSPELLASSPAGTGQRASDDARPDPHVQSGREAPAVPAAGGTHLGDLPTSAVALQSSAVAPADAGGVCLHGEAGEDCPAHPHPMTTCLAALGTAAPALILLLLLLAGTAVLARRRVGTGTSLAPVAERSPPGGWEAWRLRLALPGPSLDDLCISRT